MLISRPEPLGGCGDEEEMAQEYGFLPSQSPQQNGHYAHTGNGNNQYSTGNNRQILPENDRESRRILRVKRELERIQEAENEQGRFLF